MECCPGDKVDIVNAAVPPVMPTVPSGFPESANVTEPVGEPVPENGFTAAVNVNAAP
jgi:hypothetical protein